MAVNSLPPTRTDHRDRKGSKLTEIVAGGMKVRVKESFCSSTSARLDIENRREERQTNVGKSTEDSQTNRKTHKQTDKHLEDEKFYEGNIREYCCWLLYESVSVGVFVGGGK